jgi:protein-disulfide isomerase
MEAVMRILVSVMALAVALMCPSSGEAQSKQAKSAKTTKSSTQQSYVQRHAKVRAVRPSTESHALLAPGPDVRDGIPIRTCAR